MAKKLYEESSIQGIANAIRAKNGSSDTYTVGDMATAIQNIPTGGGGLGATISLKDITSFSPKQEGIKKIKIDEGVEVIGVDAFYAINWKTLCIEFPSTIEEIKSRGVYINDMEELVFKGNNIPSIEGDSLYNDDTIVFVPDNLIDSYKQIFNNYYSSFLLFPLSEIVNSNDNWNFLSANNTWVDTIHGLQLTNNGVSWTANNGAIFDSTDDYLAISEEILRYNAIKKVEWEVDVIKAEGNAPRMLGITTSLGSSGDTMYGIMYYQNEWVFWGGISYPLVNPLTHTKETATSAFDNSTIKITYSPTGEYERYKIKIYKNGIQYKFLYNAEEIDEIELAMRHDGSSDYFFCIGSHRNCMRMKITGARRKTIFKSY